MIIFTPSVIHLISPTSGNLTRSYYGSKKQRKIGTRNSQEELRKSSSSFTQGYQILEAECYGHPHSVLISKRFLIRMHKNQEIIRNRHGGEEQEETAGVGDENVNAGWLGPVLRRPACEELRFLAMAQKRTPEQ